MTKLDDYVKEIGKITETSLGWEDHGILTAYLRMDFGSSGQVVGGYMLDAPQRDEKDQFLGRQGTAYGMEWIRRAMQACGVDSWEKVKGRTIFVLREERFGQPVGIAPLPTEPGTPFIFKELNELLGVASGNPR